MKTIEADTLEAWEGFRKKCKSLYKHDERENICRRLKKHFDTYYYRPENAFFIHERYYTTNSRVLKRFLICYLATREYNTYAECMDAAIKGTLEELGLEADKLSARRKRGEDDTFLKSFYKHVTSIDGPDHDPVMRAELNAAAFLKVNYKKFDGVFLGPARCLASRIIQAERVR